MKKSVFFTLLLFFNCTYFQAQNVINTCGSNFTNAQYSITFSVGEPITSTFSANTIILTQGFLQPTSKGNNISSTTDNSNCDFQIFPNPTSGQVQTTVGTAILEGSMLQVYDMAGRLVAHIPTNQNSIDLQKVPDGIYLIRMLCQNGSFLWKSVAKIH